MGRYNTLNEDIQRLAGLMQIAESVRVPLDEIDFENEFSGTQRECVSPEQVVEFLNKQLSKKQALDQQVPVIPNAFKNRLDKEGTFSIDKVIQEITKPPKQIWGQNGKMTSGNGENIVFFDMGLPAYKAIVYDLEHQQFYFVTTCPGAGVCTGYCYAMNNRYIMFEGAILNATRILNYLLNKPESFKRQLESETEKLCNEYKDKNIRFRWHDSGDFFAMAYIKVAKQITDDLTRMGYNVKSYAYTKIAEAVMTLSAPNFVIRFSEDANDEEKAKLGTYDPLWSKTVPSAVTKGLYVKKETTDEKTGKVRLSTHPLKDEEGHWVPVDASFQEIKKAVADHYNIDIGTIKMNNELLNIPEGDVPVINAIVSPGESDLAATRSDVKTVFLLIH